MKKRKEIELSYYLVEFLKWNATTKEFTEFGYRIIVAHSNLDARVKTNTYIKPELIYHIKTKKYQAFTADIKSQMIFNRYFSLN